MFVSRSARLRSDVPPRSRLGPALHAATFAALLMFPVPQSVRAEDCPPLREPRIPAIPGPVDQIDPTNIDKVKKQLNAYKAGNYDYDVSAVIADARVYIDRRMAQSVAKPAVVLDIDETSLSNWPNLKADDFGFFLDVDCKSGELPCGFNNWVMMAAAPPIQPTLQFFNYLASRNIPVFFITGRRDKQRAKTEENLAAAGFKGWARLVTRPDDDNGGSLVPFKSGEREKIEKEGYTILADIGDQRSDIEGNATGTHFECAFKIPNPFYFIP
ncbi:HAD family acid phosphatase [Bradyrhizobium erythrophlei]|uniref:HAD family acid phosphatase n=1 Tax=Bradyrhizobium erythrophlei TaxID=1437360 RepID=UPI0035E9CDC4